MIGADSHGAPTRISENAPYGWATGRFLEPADSCLRVGDPAEQPHPGADKPDAEPLTRRAVSGNRIAIDLIDDAGGVDNLG